MREEKAHAWLMSLPFSSQFPIVWGAGCGSTLVKERHSESIAESRLIPFEDTAIGAWPSEQKYSPDSSCMAIVQEATGQKQTWWKGRQHPLTHTVVHQYPSARKGQCLSIDKGAVSSNRAKGNVGNRAKQNRTEWPQRIVSSLASSTSKLMGIGITFRIPDPC